MKEAGLVGERARFGCGRDQASPAAASAGVRVAGVTIRYVRG